jgi:glycosyltransferase involved in cell wall biosynthesis
MNSYVNSIYYFLKPYIPRSVQLAIRRNFVLRRRSRCADVWPIDERAINAPQGWSGWPGGKRFALVLTHDVETAEGQEKCGDLMQLEEKLGFRSSFNFVPERYTISTELRHQLSASGYEVGIHGLYHDGKYYRSRKIFRERTKKINRYLRDWEAVGFRSPSMMRNLDWFHDLDIEYDASTFDTDPFEPQSDGMKTIFPFRVSKNGNGSSGYVELPYTLPQDFTLFVIMREKNTDIWRRKLDWIAEQGGMALVITHPDYMNFDGVRSKTGEYPAEYYQEFLEYIKSFYEGQYWNVLPKDIARYWEENYSGAGCPVTIASEKPNVLMIVENYFPIDTRVRREAYTLKEEHHITVIALKRREEKVHEKLSGIDIWRIPEFPELGLGKIGYILQYLYFTSCSALIFMSTFIFKSYKAIHVHNPPDTLFLIGLMAKLFSRKFIFDHHDLSPELYLTRFSREKDFIYKTLLLCEKMSYKLADVIVSTNMSYKQIATERHHVDPERIYIVRNDPIIEECTPGKDHIAGRGERDNTTKLLFVGSINPQDGVDMLLHAIHYLIHSIDEKGFICSIVGDGDSLESMKQLSRQLDLGNFVEFTGYIYERAKVREFLHMADICVEPAPENELNRHSTFIKIMEYMAVGKPIVAFDLKETRYSTDGTALLVPSGDVAGFAHAIKRLLDEPLLREELGRAGFERIERGLNWQTAASSLLKAYRTLTLI